MGFTKCTLAILDHFSQQSCSNQFWRLSCLKSSVWVMPQHSVRLKGGVLQMLKPFGRIFTAVFGVMLFWMTHIQHRPSSWHSPVKYSGVIRISLFPQWLRDIRVLMIFYYNSEWLDSVFGVLEEGSDYLLCHLTLFFWYGFLILDLWVVRAWKPLIVTSWHFFRNSQGKDNCMQM